MWYDASIECFFFCFFKKEGCCTLLDMVILVLVGGLEQVKRLLVLFENLPYGGITFSFKKVTTPPAISLKIILTS